LLAIGGRRSAKDRRSFGRWRANGDDFVFIGATLERLGLALDAICPRPVVFHRQHAHHLVGAVGSRQRRAPRIEVDDLPDGEFMPRHGLAPDSRENTKKGPGAILTLPFAERSASIRRRRRRYIRGRQSA
jgi:hypothetical protein